MDLGTNFRAADTDNDGLNDSVEVSVGSNPLLRDSDFDGLIDGNEPNPTEDGDADGLINILDPDQDNDGLPDGIEVTICGTPTCANPTTDTDGDGLSNIDEIELGTDPTKSDTDGDGTPDGTEVTSNCDPRVPELTTVVGRTVDEQGTPIAGATVRSVHASSRTAVTDVQGSFRLASSPACRNIRVAADILVGNTRLVGSSALVVPIMNGTTDSGDIVLRLNPILYPGAKFTAGAFPNSVAVADVNGDGRLDVVTANIGFDSNGSNDVSVLLGNGDGTFQAQQRFTVGSSPFSVVAADVNGDGRLDVVTANGGSNDVSVLLHQ